MAEKLDYIYSATNERLAELLINTAPYSMEFNEIRNEAARRLKAKYGKPEFEDKEFYF